MVHAVNEKIMFNNQTLGAIVDFLFHKSMKIWKPRYIFNPQFSRKAEVNFLSPF